MALKTFGSAVAAASILLSTPAFAQDGFGDWDADANAGINNEEFDARFKERGAFTAWDADRDGALSEDEFNKGAFGAYDDDEDGIIEEPEFGDIGDDMGDGGLFDV